MLGCWDYEHFSVEQYPLPDWFGELPNIEKAFREVASWPFVYNETNANRLEFKAFAEEKLELTEREAVALTVAKVDLTSGLNIRDIILVSEGKRRLLF